MFERFTKQAIKVIMRAQEESRRLGHNFVGTEQILLGLLDDKDSIAGSVLKAQGVNLKDARVEVEKIIHRGSGFVAVEIPFTPRSKRALELSWKESKSFGKNYIGAEHLLLGLIKEGDGVACRVLKNFGVSLPALRQAIIDHKDFNTGSERVGRDYAPESSGAPPDLDVDTSNQCPNCMEVILTGALLCRFCNSGLSVEHYEECSFCREMIRKGAKLCRYCRSKWETPLPE